MVRYLVVVYTELYAGLAAEDDTRRTGRVRGIVHADFAGEVLVNTRKQDVFLRMLSTGLSKKKKNSWK